MSCISTSLDWWKFRPTTPLSSVTYTGSSFLPHCRVACKITTDHCKTFCFYTLKTIISYAKNNRINKNHSKTKHCKLPALLWIWRYRWKKINIPSVGLFNITDEFLQFFRNINNNTKSHEKTHKQVRVQHFTFKIWHHLQTTYFAGSKWYNKDKS